MSIDLLPVVIGGVIVASVLFSALLTVVLPRGGITGITRFVFAIADRVFITRGSWRPVPRRFKSLYAPVALVSLPFAWTMLVTVGFTLIFWGLDDGTLGDAFTTSGSSLFTLGFAKPATGGLIWLTFVEATIGLGLVALLISFLPTLYAAYSDRERGVGLLEPLVGTPPSAAELLRRLHFTHSLDAATVWGPASQWFIGLAQSHGAFPALCSFPSQRADQSWVVTSGAVLDAAAIRMATFDGSQGDPAAKSHIAGQAQLAAPLLVLAHGIPALVRVARSAGLAVDEPLALIEVAARRDIEPPPISVSRTEFDEALALLAANGVLDDLDADRCWHRYAWIRSGYDTALLGLAGITDAPPAPWGADRAHTVGRPRFFSRRPLRVAPHP